MLQQKQGFSIELMKGRVHAGLMKGRSMRSIIDDIKVARAERYGKLVLISAAAINELKCKGLLDPSASFQPWSIDLFFKTHKLPDANSLTDMWIKLVDPWVYASEQLRGSLEVRKMMMIDGTYKYAKRVKVWTNGKCHQPDEMKLIFFVANEIGQVIQWSFAKSEGHEQIGPLLKEAAKCHRPGSGSRPSLVLVAVDVGTCNTGDASYGQVQRDDGGGDGDGLDDSDGEMGDGDSTDNDEEADAGMPDLAEDNVNTEANSRNDDKNGDDDDDDSNDDGDDGFVLAREYSDTEINTLLYSNIAQIDFPEIPESRNIIVMTDNAFCHGKYHRRNGSKDPKHLVWRPKKSIHLDYYNTTFRSEFSKQIYRENGQVFERKEMFLNIRQLFGAVPTDKIKDQAKFTRTFLKALLHIQAGHLTPPNGENFHWENGMYRKLLTTSPLECHNLLVNDVKPLRCIGPIVSSRVIELTCLQTNIAQGEKFGRIPPLHGQNIIDLIETTIFSTEVRDNIRQNPTVRQQVVSWSKVFQIPLPPRSEIRGALLPESRLSAAPPVSSLPHTVETFVTNVLKTTMPAIRDQIPFSVEEQRLLLRIRSEQLGDGEQYGVKIMATSELVTSILFNEYVLSSKNTTSNTRGLHAIRNALKILKIDQQIEPSTTRLLKLRPPRLTCSTTDGQFSDVEKLFSQRVFDTLGQYEPKRSEKKDHFRAVWEYVTCIDPQIRKHSSKFIDNRYDACMKKAKRNLSKLDKDETVVEISVSEQASTTRPAGPTVEADVTAATENWYMDNVTSVPETQNSITMSLPSFHTVTSTVSATNPNGAFNWTSALNSSMPPFLGNIPTLPQPSSFYVPVPLEFQQDTVNAEASSFEVSKEILQELKEEEKLSQIAAYAESLSGGKKWSTVQDYAVRDVDKRYKFVATKWLNNTCRNYLKRIQLQDSSQSVATRAEPVSSVNTQQQPNLHTTTTQQSQLATNVNNAQLGKKRPASTQKATTAKKPRRQSCD
ncbi:hypothetical protein HDU76_005172, partial [Blyttiomyces sp. JEL0837]